MARSEHSAYAAVLTPNHHLRKIEGISFEIYRETMTLMLAVQQKGDVPYRVLWQVEIENSGFDSVRLAVSDRGDVLVATDSIGIMADDPFLRVYNGEGHLKAAFSRSALETGFPWAAPLEVGKIAIHGRGEMIVLAYDLKPLLRIAREKK